MPSLWTGRPRVPKSEMYKDTNNIGIGQVRELTGFCTACVDVYPVSCYMHAPFHVRGLLLCHSCIIGVNYNCLIWLYRCIHVGNYNCTIRLYRCQYYCTCCHYIVALLHKSGVHI